MEKKTLRAPSHQKNLIIAICKLTVNNNIGCGRLDLNISPDPVNMLTSADIIDDCESLGGRFELKTRDELKLCVETEDTLVNAHDDVIIEAVPLSKAFQVGWNP